jgi:hypothetical protein
MTAEHKRLQEALMNCSAREMRTDAMGEAAYY